jgi:sulfite reductase alpha subunit-like flavoprotein
MRSFSNVPYSPELVKQLAARVGVSLSEEFTLHADTSIGTLETPFPCPTSVSHVLTNYLDINGSVSKTMLRRLGQLAKDENERAKLLQVRPIRNISTDDPYNLNGNPVTLLQLSAKVKDGASDMYDIEVRASQGTPDSATC